MALSLELKNSIDDIYSLTLNKNQLRLLGIPQDYSFERIEEEVREILNDEGLKKGLLSLSSALFNFLSAVNINDLTTNVKVLLEKYSEKLEKLDKVYKILENLPAEEYKEYWLDKYFHLLDTLTKNEEEFLKFVEEREGTNSLMELYYKVFTELLTDLVGNLRHYEAKRWLKARDDVKLKALVSTINTLLFTLSYPILAYLEGNRIDYDALAFLITVFARSSKIKDKYSELIGEAFFG
ncbi:MAG: hypothetical protein OWQ54_03380 [Sulfolobaceae archaeon]|nr:hypothetical protein [Sulfolobaceae archaeon]